MASEILSEYNILLKIPTGLWVIGEGKIHTDVAQSIVQESSGYGPWSSSIRCDGNLWGIDLKYWSPASLHVCPAPDI